MFVHKEKDIVKAGTQIQYSGELHPSREGEQQHTCMLRSGMSGMLLHSELPL